MTTYTFDTTVTMKPYNHNKYWIDRKYVPLFETTAETLDEALEKYREHVNDDCLAVVTKNGLKHKQPMYRDYKDGSTKQVGYVITAAVDILAGEYRVYPERYVRQYVDLWVTVTQEVDFDEEAQYGH